MTKNAICAVLAQVPKPTTLPIATVDGTDIYHYREFDYSPSSEDYELYVTELRNDPNIKLEFRFDVIPAPQPVIDYFTDSPGMKADVTDTLDRRAMQLSQTPKFKDCDLLKIKEAIHSNFALSVEGANWRARLRNGGTLKKKILESYKRMEI